MSSTITPLDISIVAKSSKEIIVEARHTLGFKKLFVGIFILISFMVVFGFFNNWVLGNWIVLGIILITWGLFLAVLMFVFSVKVIVLDKKEDKMVVLRRFKKGTFGRTSLSVPLGTISRFKEDIIAKNTDRESRVLSVVFKDGVKIRVFFSCDIVQVYEVIELLNGFLAG